jgi:RimJ/RimL family protein N-acetyltransferase
MRVLMDDQMELLAWAAARTGCDGWPSDTEAMGVIDEDGKIRAVASFNLWHGYQCSMHIASDGSKAWATAWVAKLIFGYLFEFRGLRRVNCVTRAKDRAATIFALKLGFSVEGTAKSGAYDGSDGVLFGMLREDCPWLGAKG